MSIEKINLALDILENIENEKCFEDMRKVINGKFGEKLINAWSPFEDFGVGNSYDFGSFNDCMEIGKVASPFQFCMVQYFPKYSKVNNALPNATFFTHGWPNNQYRYGGAICIPSICSMNNLKSLMRTIFEDSNLKLSEDYKQEDFCKNYENFVKNPTTKFQLISIILITTLILLTLYCTTVDVLNSAQLSQVTQIFSIRSNFYRFIKNFDNSDEISCFNGIKAISMLIIISAHSVQIRTWFPFRRGDDIDKWKDNFLFYQPSAWMVENFLILSGFLAVKSNIRKMNSNQFNFFEAIFIRYMRLTPAYVVVILSYTSILQFQSHRVPYLFVSGFCEKFWWSGLLHAQNIFNTLEMCMNTSWYLSVEFQLFLFVPLFTWIAKKANKAVGIFLTIVFTFCNCFYCFMFFVRYPASIDTRPLSHTSLSESMHNYCNTFVRSLSYVYGMIFGFILCHTKSININKKFTQLLFYLSTTILIVFSCIIWTFHENSTDVITAGIMISISRVLWSISLIFIINCCINGTCNALNRFLSLHIWKIMSRMGLSLYLVSGAVQFVRTASRHKPMELNGYFEIGLNFTSDLAISVLFATLLFLFVEEPFIRLSNFMLKRRGKDIKIN